MAIGKTYLSGKNGLFKVYDHTTTVWTDYTGFTTQDLYDVKTDHSNPNYAIVCGSNYIGYTTDAGATVQSIAVNPTQVTRALQISIPTTVSQTIYICGTGSGKQVAVLKSTDGGITYTLCINGLDGVQYGNTAFSVHFKDNLIGVIGHSKAIAKTIDGGANWTYLNGGLEISADYVSGVHISADESVIVAVTSNDIFRSTDSGTTFTSVYDIIAADGDYAGTPLKYTHLTWYDDNTMWVSGSNGPILYSSDAGATWSEVYPPLDPGSDIRSIWAAHFYTPTDGFFAIDDGGNAIGAVFKAENASTTITATVSNDYYASGNIATAVWTLVKDSDIYALYDCTGQANPIYSTSPILSSGVSRVINIVGSPLCWSVNIIAFDDQTLVDVEIANNTGGYPLIFDDCTCCLPPAPPAPAKYTRVIPKPDRHFYQVTQSQCDISSNIKFAEAYYRLFKNLKYGINSECNTVNLDSIWIKKQLSDLAVINDPTACTIVTPTPPVICPEPS